MSKRIPLLVPTLMSAAAALSLTACGGSDGADGLNGAGQVITLSRAATTAAQAFDASAAEIVAFDATNKNVLVVNANSGKIDVFAASSVSDVEGADPAQSLDLANMLLTAGKVTDAALVGAANSVDVHGDLAAIAVEANPKTDNGWVVFVNVNTLTYVNAVEVGALPDMLTFTPDGSKVVVANEGEPDAGFVNDPNGSVSVITVSDYSVKTATFTDFNSDGSRYSELPQAKMIIDGYSPTSATSKPTVAQTLEPEYIAVSSDSAKAYVTLQENNAVAVIKLSDASVDKIIGLGFKDHSIPGNELDASQKDGVNIKNWPVMGMYMPDSIAAYSFNGKTYFVTANEGDDRQDWLDGVTDQASCEAAGYFFDGNCIDAFTAKDFYDADNVTLVDSEGNPFKTKNGVAVNGGFGEDNALRRLKFSYFVTQAKNKGTEFTKLYAYGGRSFSIWDATTGEQVFDSGSEMERITAKAYGEDFNNDNAANIGDDRSDNKGPEPEGVTIGQIGGHTYAFIGLERIGGVMVYDVSNPFAPNYVQYINNRDVTVAFDPKDDLGNGEVPYTSAVGDLGPEGLTFVAAEKSPTGKPMLLVGNEVSGTTTIYNIDVNALQD